MLARNCSIDDLQAALDAVNTLFDENIRFKAQGPEVQGSAIRFGLTVKDSKLLGARRGVGMRAGRRISAACWHVHGHFFDCLFEKAPQAVVRSGGRTITKDEGNWIDWSIGSIMYPADYSSACECWNAGETVGTITASLIDHEPEGYFSRGRSVQG